MHVLIGSRNLEYPWIFTVLRTERKRAHCVAKVSDEEIAKTAIPLRVGGVRWIYTSTIRVSVYIHNYSPPFWGIVVYYYYYLSLSSILCQERINAMEKLADTSNSFNMTIWFGHHPFSVTTTPSVRKILR